MKKLVELDDHQIIHRTTFRVYFLKDQALHSAQPKRKAKGTFKYYHEGTERKLVIDATTIKNLPKPVIVWLAINDYYNPSMKQRKALKLWTTTS